MNDTVATEDQEQPAGAHERKARSSDRNPGRRTASRPAGICSSALKAGHMGAADQIIQSAKKALAREGRPHMDADPVRPRRVTFRRSTLSKGILVPLTINCKRCERTTREFTRGRGRSGWLCRFHGRRVNASTALPTSPGCRQRRDTDPTEILSPPIAPRRPGLAQAS